MRHPDALESFGGVVKGVIKELRSDEFRMMGRELMLRGRWTLAFILHPVATTRVVFMIGDNESLERDTQTMRSLPKLLKFPIGGQRF